MADQERVATIPEIDPDEIYIIPPRVDFDPNDQDHQDALIKRGATLTGDDVVKIADNKQWHAMRARNTARNWQRLVFRLNPSSGAPSPYYAGRDSGKPVEDPSNCPWRLMELVSYWIDEHSAAEVAEVLEEIYSALPRIDDPRATYEDNATLLFVEALASWLRRCEDEDKTP